MYSLLGTKMYRRPQDWSIFIAGRYSLVGPKGPFGPSEWREKVFPGCRIELHRESAIEYPLQKPQMLQLPASPRENNKFSSQSEISARNVISLPRTTSLYFPSKGKKRDVNSLEHLSPGPHEGQSSIHSEARYHSIDSQRYPNSVHAVSAGHISESEADKASQIASRSDETEHSTRELRPNADFQVDLEGEEFVPRKLGRKNTDMQSFVEDDTEADDYLSVATGHSSLPSDLLEQVGPEISEEEIFAPEVELEPSVTIEHSADPNNPMERDGAEICEDGNLTPENELEPSVSNNLSEQGKS